MQHHARRADILEGFLLSAFFFYQREDSAHVLFIGKNGGQDDGLLDFLDLAGIEPARGIIYFDHGAVSLRDFIAHAGSGGDEVKIELALQALLDDFHVEQAEKAATEAETESY